MNLSDPLAIAKANIVNTITANPFVPITAFITRKIMNTAIPRIRVRKVNPVITAQVLSIISVTFFISYS